MSEKEKRKIIRELEITNYRRFKKLKVERIACVNLFVGKNNSGKTTLLEALEIISSGGNEAIFKSLEKRQELLVSPSEGPNLKSEVEVDVSCLFHGHNPSVPEPSFEIKSGEAVLHCEVVEKGNEAFPTPFGPSELAFSYKYSKSPNQSTMASYPLSGKYGINFEMLKRRGPQRRYTSDGSANVQMVGTAEVSMWQLSQLWADIALTPEQEDVIQALQIIESGIEDIVFTTSDQSLAPSAFLKSSSEKDRIRLGSLGDGMKRILTLIMNLVSAKNGVLLVDEIDTGLHYSVIEDMWRVIIKTAIRLDIQVFATTHSRDCLDALAGVLEDEEDWGDDIVQVHRIEADNEKTVAYSRDEIITAARSHIEVR